MINCPWCCHLSGWQTPCKQREELLGDPDTKTASWRSSSTQRAALPTCQQRRNKRNTDDGYIFTKPSFALWCFFRCCRGDCRKAGDLLSVSHMAGCLLCLVTVSWPRRYYVELEGCKKNKKHTERSRFQLRALKALFQKCKGAQSREMLDAPQPGVSWCCKGSTMISEKINDCAECMRTHNFNIGITGL